MSDSTQQYILKQPIEATPRSAEYYGKEVYDVVLKTETLMHHFDPIRKELFDELFEPLDIPAIEKQLEGHLASFIVNVTEYVDLCDHAQNAEELNAIRGHFNRCQHEHIAQVLRLFGLENKRTEQ